KFAPRAETMAARSFATFFRDAQPAGHRAGACYQAFFRPGLLAPLPLTIFLADFFFAFFFTDLVAGTVFFFVAERPLPPKMFSQLSEYFSVAPIRVMLMVESSP
ncbi:MAG: hypothetical protein L0Z07_00960, partial [Planctomycetes bacterium]|nr:hypothetical protein [Planctomycetota bacterium]